MQQFRNSSRLQGLTRSVLLAGIASAMLAAAPARASDAQTSEQGAVPTTQVVLRALSLLGVHYKLGGNSPDTGLDCSGLVRNVFQDVVGMVLPRRSVEMSRAGEAIADTAQLKPGDLVFFRTIRKAVSHVGIYIGNNQFVHAPSRNGAVRVDSMSEKYWNHRYVSARRMPLGMADANAGPALTFRTGGTAGKGLQPLGPLPGYLERPAVASDDPNSF